MATKAKHFLYGAAVTFVLGLACSSEPARRLGDVLLPDAGAADEGGSCRVCPSPTFQIIADGELKQGAEQSQVISVAGFSEVVVYVDGRATCSGEQLDVVPQFRAAPDLGFGYTQQVVTRGGRVRVDAPEMRLSLPRAAVYNTTCSAPATMNGAVTFVVAGVRVTP